MSLTGHGASLQLHRCYFICTTAFRAPHPVPTMHTVQHYERAWFP